MRCAVQDDWQELSLSGVQVCGYGWIPPPVGQIRGLIAPGSGRIGNEWIEPIDLVKAADRPEGVAGIVVQAAWILILEWRFVLPTNGQELRVLLVIEDPSVARAERAVLLVRAIGIGIDPVENGRREGYRTG